MRRNISGQFVGAQMIAAADGTAFTGAVTVSVTGDAGTQATGSVGSGACTHEGNGFHTYAPAQAETNYTHVAFTFTGTGAIPATVQIYPISYDASGRVDVGSFGGTAGTFSSGRPEVNTTHWGGTAVASAVVSANAIQISGDSTAADNAEAFFDGTGYAGTNNVIPTVTTLTNLPAITANWLTATGIASDAITAAKLAADVTTELQSGLATAANLATVAGYLDTEIAAILADTNELQTDWANGGRLDLILDARASQTSVDDLPTNAELATALAAADDAVLTAIGDLPTAVENADALLGRNVAGGSSSGRTVKEAFYFLRNKWIISGGTLTVYAVDDTTSAWTASVTQTAGDPVSASDPA